ncbi:hypothetical protein AK812_SmicGene35128 [Symbiodinium microadriaticum]|uniref:Uncharacterized protein n=1 Tax=Symbiodinium microadriaticum TaxID=2951 RepID=A0A1Q9CM88_SYMMI|nr:hypothetical protein AK812_SmicGene35128 [Symbiodinium microadriaticum]
MREIPWTRGEEPTFFETDFWHNWHNGLAKLFIASVVVLYMTDGILPGTTIPERFRWLSEDYRAFCKSAGFTPFLLELTKDTFGYESYKKAPLGSWNKAVVSTHLMLYLDNLSARRVLGKTEDQLLLNVASSLISVMKVDVFAVIIIVVVIIMVVLVVVVVVVAALLVAVAVISTLYSEGFWIPAELGRKLGQGMVRFLVYYQAYMMLWEAQHGEWIRSLLAYHIAMQ